MVQEGRLAAVVETENDFACPVGAQLCNEAPALALVRAGHAKWLWQNYDGKKHTTFKATRRAVRRAAERAFVHQTQ